MDKGSRIKAKRIEKGYTLLEVANKLGIREATMQRYESGTIKNIKYDTMSKLAEILDTTPAYLSGWEDAESATVPNVHSIKYHKIPKLGCTAAGTPHTREYDGEDYVEVSQDIQADYCLDIKGNSMSPLIQDGDIVFLRFQEWVNNGEIAVVMIDGEATLKKFYKYDHQVQLVALNPDFPTIIINDNEEHDLRIVGKALCYCRHL